MSVKVYENHQYIKVKLDSSVFSVRVICSNYLPEWRQGLIIEGRISADAKQGGVSIDLIHEWDYLNTYLVYQLPCSIYEEIF